MSKVISVIVIAATAGAASATEPAEAPRIKTEMSVIADDAYAATSVNTAIFRASAVTSDDKWQYAAYYDGEGRVVLARREVNGEEWEKLITPYKGRPEDAHNVISIGLDGQERLHVAFDHHGDRLRYFTTAAGQLDAGELREMTGRGEDNVTYPEFYPADGGDLIFVYRDGSSGRGNMVMNRYDAGSDRWERVHDVVIDGEDERNAYWQLCTDGEGTIHLSWVWRETWMVETNHDLCYARSRDGGKTWERSDSTPYILPITEKTAEVAWPVAQNSELINQTSMATDDEGHPYIATYWRDDESEVPQYRIVRHDGKSWKAEQVGELSRKFTLAGGGTKRIPIARPRLLAGDGMLHYIFRADERGGKVTMASRRIAGPEGEWEVEDLTEESVGAWEPMVDNEAWRRRGEIDIYVQRSGQGDGERVSDEAPTTAGIMRVKR